MYNDDSLIGGNGYGYPYTNLHNVNLDWIIKIVKDCKDKYDKLEHDFADQQQAFEDFKTYVNNWLANLDVPAYVRQWLDEALAAGTLTPIIQDVFGNTKLFIADTESMENNSMTFQKIGAQNIYTDYLEQELNVTYEPNHIYAITLNCEMNTRGKPFATRFNNSKMFEIMNIINRLPVTVAFFQEFCYDTDFPENKNLYSNFPYIEYSEFKANLNNIANLGIISRLLQKIKTITNYSDQGSDTQYEYQKQSILKTENLDIRVSFRNSYNYWPLVDTTTRPQQLRQLNSILQNAIMSFPTWSFITAGDFNITQQSDYNLITEGIPNLKPVFVDTPTWQTYPHDNILYLDNKMRVNDTKVIDMQGLSDHKMLWVDFEIL